MGNKISCKYLNDTFDPIELNISTNKYIQYFNTNINIYIYAEEHILNNNYFRENIKNIINLSINTSETHLTILELTNKLNEIKSSCIFDNELQEIWGTKECVNICKKYNETENIYNNLFKLLTNIIFIFMKLF